MANVSIRNTNSADLIRQLHQKPTVLSLQCIEILYGAARSNIQPFTELYSLPLTTLQLAI